MRDADGVPLFALLVSAGPREGVLRRNDGVLCERQAEALVREVAVRWIMFLREIGGLFFWGFRGAVSRGSGLSSVGNIVKQDTAHEV